MGLADDIGARAKSSGGLRGHVPSMADILLDGLEDPGRDLRD